MSLVSAWLTYYAVQATVNSDMKGAMEAFAPILKIRAAIAPISMLLSVGMQSVVVWLVASALGNSVKVKPISFRLFSIAPILEIQSIVDAASLYLKGGTPQTAHIPLGLDALITLPPGKAAVLAYTLGLPSIVWCGLLIFLLKKSFPMSTFSAVTCAVSTLALSAFVPLLSL